jgi:hypothetical protein
MRYSDELEIGSVIALHPANTDLARLPHRIETDPGAFSRGRVHRSHHPPPAREHWQVILLASLALLGRSLGMATLLVRLK